MSLSNHLRRRHSGFTLIELLVVFSIMGLMAAIVPIAFDRMRDGAQYRDTLRSIMTDLRRGRQISRLEGRETRFSLDLEHRTYGLAGGAQKKLPVSLQVRATVAGVEMRNQVASILFLPEGGATGGSIDVLQVSGRGSRLRVDWLTGHVSQEILSP